MTRRSIMEYAQALRERYFKATREEKGKMLDEFTLVTGLHREAAIRLLNRPNRTGEGKRRGPATQIRHRGLRSSESGLGRS